MPVSATNDFQMLEFGLMLRADDQTSAGFSGP